VRTQVAPRATKRPTSFTTVEIDHPTPGARYILVRNREGRDIAGAVYYKGRFMGVEVFEERDRKCNRTRISAMNALENWEIDNA